MERQREWNLSDWVRLGRAFAAKREEAGYTQVSAAEALGVSRSPIQAIERGRQSNGQPFTKVTQTMRAYASLIGWTQDSPQRILDGGSAEDTAIAPPAEEPAVADSRYGLPPAVDRELRSGETLDHAVVNLGSETDDDTRLIVVLKGAADLSEEEIDALWQKWRRTRRQLHAIPGETDAPQDS